MSEYSQAGTPNPATESESMTIQNAVDVKITVIGIDDHVIKNAKTAVFLTSDRTVVLNAETDASGIVTTTYAGPTPVKVEVRCRKASSGDNPRYVNFSCVETIQPGTGLDLTVTLLEDTINRAKS